MTTDTLLPQRKARAKRPAVFCPECGVIVRGEDKERSTPHHRRFFGVCKAAFANWPEKHEFQPESIAHLRAWLECKAGYHDVLDISDPAPSTWQAMAAFSQGRPVFVKAVKNRLIAFAPKSISYDDLEHSAACKLFANIEDIVEAEAKFRLPEKVQ